MYKYTHSIKTLPKNTVEIELKISKEEVAIAYEKAFDTLSESLEVEGFRRGKAPKNIAQKHLNKEKVYNSLLQDLLGVVYEDIVKKEGLKPIINPRIDLQKAKEGEDWTVTIGVAQKPKIVLGDYKKRLSEVKKNKKKDAIWVPGKDESAAPTEQQKAEQQQQLLNELLNELLNVVTIEISDLVMEEELNARLARLVDDIQKIGMTTDNYLKSKNVTIEDLKAQYQKEIENTHKIEFALAEIADQEKIEVGDDEIKKLFAAVKTPKEQEQVQKNAYMYTVLLRKQKTLDYLLNL